MLLAQEQLKGQQAVICNDLKHVIADNVEFKNNTNKNITSLKTDYYKTKTTVDKHSVWFTVFHTVTGAFLSYLGIKTI